MKLSVVIPARNEAQSLPKTISQIFEKLLSAAIQHEIVVVEDGSTDDTLAVLEALQQPVPTLKIAHNTIGPGFGSAVRAGILSTSGDCVAIMMADMCDDPADLVRFYQTMLEKECDCVFGSRFIKGGSVSSYPPLKLIVNRIVNTAVRLVFRIPYNDFTNAFKLYRTETIRGLDPLLSKHFNLTLELPLKAIVRGYSFAVVPNSWKGREYGISNLKLTEAGSRYLFVFVYCLIEKYLSRGDYRKR